MGQGNFTRMGLVSAAHKPRVADGVMRRTEGPLLDERSFHGEHVANGIDAGNLEGFIKAKAGEDGSYRAGEQGLPRAWWAGEQDVVTASRGNLKRPFDVLLPLDFAEINAGKEGCVRWDIRRKRGCDNRFADQMGVKRGKGIDRDDFQVRDEGCFRGIRGRDEKPAVAFLPGKSGHGQYTTYMPYGTIEGEFADHQSAFERFRRNQFFRDQYTQGNWQVEGGTFLAHGSGGEVHRERFAGVGEAGVLDGGKDSLAAFLDRLVWKTNDGHFWKPLTVVDLDFHDHAVEPNYSTGIYAGKHGHKFMMLGGKSQRKNAKYAWKRRQGVFPC